MGLCTSKPSQKEKQALALSRSLHGALIATRTELQVLEKAAKQARALEEAAELEEAAKKTRALAATARAPKTECIPARAPVCAPVCDPVRDPVCDPVRDPVCDPARAPPSSVPSPSASKKRKAAIPKVLRKAVWDTYVGEEVGSTKCLCCAGNTISQMEFHCGHVLAEACGGSTTIENLRPICAACNLSMGNKHMQTFQSQYFPTVKKISEERGPLSENPRTRKP